MPISRPERSVVFHVNEWQTAVAALYIQKVLPQIGTIFTTHATGIGRSIAGNNKPLYDYLSAYNGDQMACELNMQSKHSVEKQTAKYVDCFTTVSDITARECKELLDKPVDVVLLMALRTISFLRAVRSPLRERLRERLCLMLPML